MNLTIGDKIRDIEDGDCFYEGIVTGLNPVKYKITNILWNNEVDKSMNGQEIKLSWYIIQVYKNDKWINYKDI